MSRRRDRSLVNRAVRGGLGPALVAGLLLAGCGGSPKEAAPTTSASTTGPRPSTGSTTNGGSSSAPALVATTYTDVPAGQPGYALVVQPGPPGSNSLGGVAVFQYQDGKEVAYFSFVGRAASKAPFTVNLKGDRAGTTATATVNPGGTISIADCARYFSPAVASGAQNEAEPPAPASCSFSYKLAPGPARSSLSVTTNLTATAASKSGLVNDYLVQNGWLTQYASDISLVPGSTYLAYDPQTGLNWAYATFGFSGPATDSPGSPGVTMQDGGETGIFYQIPISGALPSADDGWVMVGNGGEPRCLALTVLPRSVTGLWGLVDPPACNGT